MAFRIVELILLKSSINKIILYKCKEITDDTN